MQLELFGYLAGNASKAISKRLKRILEALVAFAPSQSGIGDTWSCFENHVLTRALGSIDSDVVPEIRGALGVDERLATDGAGEEITQSMEFSLSAWRLSLLTPQ